MHWSSNSILLKRGTQLLRFPCLWVSIPIWKAAILLMKEEMLYRQPNPQQSCLPAHGGMRLSDLPFLVYVSRGGFLLLLELSQGHFLAHQTYKPKQTSYLLRRILCALKKKITTKRIPQGVISPSKDIILLKNWQFTDLRQFLASQLFSVHKKVEEACYVQPA